MKEKFLELIEKVKKTGIVEIMYETSTAEELKEVWRMFSEENKELFTEIEKWGLEFRQIDHKSIFEKNEEIENPMEIAIVIFIIDDAEYVSEGEIFEEWRSLSDALAKIDSKIAKRIAQLMDIVYISKLEAEYILNEKREEFLELVKDVKETGIAEQVCKTCGANELKEIWHKFLSENPELITKIKDWAEELKKSESKTIFIDCEEPENPMEIAIVIFIINDENVTECDIFDDGDFIVCAMNEFDNDIVKRFKEFIKTKYIYEITAEDLFPEEDEEDQIPVLTEN